MKRKIKAVIENHFDPIWRRCFRSDFVHGGEKFISYEKIQEYYIDENLRLAEKFPEYCFEIESPVVVENYVSRFPEKKEILKALYARGVLKTTNTGYTIIDSNMIGDETIIRNYLAADAFFAEYVGKTPSIANRCDGFGNSAQLPQILKAFGADYLMQLFYNTVGDDEVWVGLDGSAICVKEQEYLGGGGGWIKYAPCPVCKGFGKTDETICTKCEGKGIDIERAEHRRVPITLKKEALSDGVLRIGGEELMPDPDVPRQVARIASEHDIDFTFGHWDFLQEIFKNEIAQTESGKLEGMKIHGSPEYNPNTTGGYVTYSDIKSGLSRSENKLLTGETLEAIRYVCGEQTHSYGEIWKTLLLAGFHDSSAGTLVDPAYREVMKLFERIDSHCDEVFLQKEEGDTALVFNSTSNTYNGIYKSGDGRIALVNDLKPNGFRRVRFDPPAERVEAAQLAREEKVESVMTGKADDTSIDTGDRFRIENEYLIIEADNNGICSVTHKEHGLISSTVNEIRPCDFLLESDVGSAWSTLEPPYREIYLHKYSKLICKEQGESVVRLCYRISIPFTEANATGQNIIDWSVSLFKGCSRLHFEADVRWETVNKRLRVCFPLAVENARDIYGIPGGWLERHPYEPNYNWNGTNGDWPAYRWGGAESCTKSVALLNRGTPSYKILPAGKEKILYMSLLRSSNIPTYLHETPSYVMKDYNGLCDEGEHSFAFELTAYGSAFADSKVFADADSFFRPLLNIKNPLPDTDMPFITGGNASITHIKPAEDGNGIIVRITEQSGKASNVSVGIPSWTKKVFISDLPERASRELVGNTLELRAFELATLRFTL